MTCDIETCNEDDPSDQLGPLVDALIESPTADDPDEVWGPAETWPPSPEIDGFWTSEGDIILLRKLNTTPWQNFLSTPGELES